jgi:hypothetical protein
MRKTEEVESLWSSRQFPLLPPRGREAPERDETGFVGMQFQREAPQSLA